MNPLVKQVAECSMDEPLPLDPRLSSESRAFDAQREMALALRVMTAVATMLFAVVDELDERRRKR